MIFGVRFMWNLHGLGEYFEFIFTSLLWLFKILFDLLIAFTGESINYFMFMRNTSKEMHLWTLETKLLKG